MIAVSSEFLNCLQLGNLVPTGVNKLHLYFCHYHPKFESLNEDPTKDLWNGNILIFNVSN